MHLSACILELELTVNTRLFNSTSRDTDHTSLSTGAITSKRNEPKKFNGILYKTKQRRLFLNIYQETKIPRIEWVRAVESQIKTKLIPIIKIKDKIRQIL